MRTWLIGLLLGCALPSPARAAALDQLLRSAGADAPPPVAAPAGRPVHGRRVLKVLTFNIKDNPDALLTGWGLQRFDRIGAELARRRAKGEAPDVVLLQEAFEGGAARVRAGAGYPHEARGPRPDRTLLDGGLWVLSQLPITGSRTLEYPRSACSSYDCLANKGAVAVRLSVPGVPFPVEIITTHAQSGGKPEAERGREEQFRKLAAAFKPGGADHPVIAAGDFNTDPRRPESYGLLASLLGLPNAGEQCLREAKACAVARGTDPAELYSRTHDQQFYSPAGDGFRMRPVYAARTFAPSGTYSDHLGYEVWYELSW